MMSFKESKLLHGSELQVSASADTPSTVQYRANVMYYGAAQDALAEAASKEAQSLSSAAIDAYKAHHESRVENANEAIMKVFEAWGDATEELLIYTWAAEAKKCVPGESTNGEWESRPLDSHYDHFLLNEKRSNEVFRMTATIASAYLSYRDEEKGIKEKWTVRWDVYPNVKGLRTSANVIEGQEKNFFSREDAEKYIAGRKKYAEKKYFSEETPEVPRDLRHFFLIGPGVRIPWIRYEAEEK